jgi:FAD binding domain
MDGVRIRSFCTIDRLNMVVKQLSSTLTGPILGPLLQFFDHQPKNKSTPLKYPFRSYDRFVIAGVPGKAGGVRAASNRCGCRKMKPYRSETAWKAVLLDQRMAERHQHNKKQQEGHHRMRMNHSLLPPILLLLLLLIVSSAIAQQSAPTSSEDVMFEEEWNREEDGEDSATSNNVCGPVQRADVLVIGCGLAGLFAAARLKREGVSVIMVEADEKCGGRLRSQLVSFGGTDSPATAATYTFEAAANFMIGRKRGNNFRENPTSRLFTGYGLETFDYATRGNPPGWVSGWLNDDCLLFPPCRGVRRLFSEN